jgi:16S rRNA processing protein RimM
MDETIYVELEDHAYIPLDIERVRPHKNVLIVKFKNINNINDVLKYKGLFVYSEEKNEEIEDDEFYYDELIDKEVYLENGERIGIVLSVIEVPQGHILEIETNTKKTLIPFRKEFVVEVSNTIVIKSIEGLL